MIPFEELATALEAFRRRRQVETELNGPPDDGNGVQHIKPESTNEIDINSVDVVDDSSN